MFNAEIFSVTNLSLENTMGIQPTFWFGRIGMFRVDAAPTDSNGGPWAVQISVRPTKHTAITVKTLHKMLEDLPEGWEPITVGKIEGIRVYVVPDHVPNAIGDAVRVMLKTEGGCL